MRSASQRCGISNGTQSGLSSGNAGKVVLGSGVSAAMGRIHGLRQDRPVGHRWGGPLPSQSGAARAIAAARQRDVARRRNKRPPAVVGLWPRYGAAFPPWPGRRVRARVAAIAQSLSRFGVADRETI